MLISYDYWYTVYVSMFTKVKNWKFFETSTDGVLVTISYFFLETKSLALCAENVRSA